MTRIYSELLQVRLTAQERDFLARHAPKTVGGASALVRAGLRLLPQWPAEHGQAAAAALEPSVSRTTVEYVAPQRDTTRHEPKPQVSAPQEPEHAGFPRKPPCPPSPHDLADTPVSCGHDHCRSKWLACRCPDKGRRKAIARGELRVLPAPQEVPDVW